MSKIVITGGSLNGNSGAEAMLVTIIARVNEQVPNSTFGIYSPYYVDDRIVWTEDTNKVTLFNSSPIYLALVLTPLSLLAGLCKFLHLRFLRPLFPKAIQFLWTSDALFDIAGIAFNDKRIKFVAFNVLSILPALLLGVPVYKLAQALGPFENPINRISAKFVLNRCKLVFARGQKTFDHVAKLKLKTEVHFAPDIVFLNEMGDALTQNNHSLLEHKINAIKTAKEQGKKVVGICPSSVVQKNMAAKNIDYPDFLSRLITELISKGHFVVLYPNATKEHKPHTRRNNDIPLLHDIETILPKKISANSAHFVTFDFNINSDGVSMLIKELDINLVSRFHAMIFSLNTCTPPLVIGWSHKYLEIMSLFQLSDYVLDFAETEPAHMMPLLENYLNNSDTIRKQIKEQLPIVIKQATYQITYSLQHLTED